MIKSTPPRNTSWKPKLALFLKSPNGAAPSRSKPMTGCGVTEMFGRCAHAGEAAASAIAQTAARMLEPQRQAGPEGEPVRREIVGEHEVELHEWPEADGGG